MYLNKNIKWKTKITSRNNSKNYHCWNNSKI